MKIQNYSDFSKRLHTTAREKGLLLRVMFELTYRCNFRCGHCYVPESYRDYGELDTKEVFSVLEQLKEAGCFYLGFTGGEPFLREDIVDILDYAKRLGFNIIIYTNGSFIDKDMADFIADIFPNKVEITVPAVTEKVFKTVTGAGGYRDKVFNAIDLLHKRGVNLGVKTCQLKSNISEVQDIREFAELRGIQHKLDVSLSPRLDGSEEPYKYRCDMPEREVSLLRKEEVCDYLGKEQRINFAKDRDNLIDNAAGQTSLFRCGAGLMQAAITPLGELKICVEIGWPKYKIDTGHKPPALSGLRPGGTQDTRHRTQDTRRMTHDTGVMELKTAWEKLKRDVAGIEPDDDYKCGNCDLKAYCGWCPAYSWYIKRTFTSCNPECYEKAKLFKEAQSRLYF